MTTRIEPPASGSQTAVAASGVLAAWSAHDWRDGIDVVELAALDALIVETQNSTYEIVAVGGGTARVLVRGGAFFPVFTPARIAGSSLGGAFLKLHGIHVGFRLELSTDNGFVITSTVRRVTRAAEPTNPADVM